MTVIAFPSQPVRSRRSPIRAHDSAHPAQLSPQDKFDELVTAARPIVAKQSASECAVDLVDRISEAVLAWVHDWNLDTDDRVADDHA